MKLLASRAERRAWATQWPLPGLTQPARVLLGDRPMYLSDEGSS
jgi:hypothetical protein